MATKKDSSSPKRNGLSEAINKATEYLREFLGNDMVIGEITGAQKFEEGWGFEFEIIDKNEYMEVIGIPNPIWERNIYSLMLDSQLKLVSFQRKEREVYT